MNSAVNIEPRKEKQAMAIYRIVIGPKRKDGQPSDIFKIYNLEIDGEAPDLGTLHDIFCNGVTEEVIKKMPDGAFLEVMYKNAVIDPEQTAIIRACASKGVAVEAAKVGYRYYGACQNGVYVNKLVRVSFRAEPVFTTLKPRGSRQPMEYFDLRVMSDDDLKDLSIKRELHLSLAQMKRIAAIQTELNLESVTDVLLETFAARWSDHCFHTTWKALGLFKILKEATAKIGNPNLLSAFVDNAGVWDFYDGLAILFKLETHNSPTKSEAYGGQLTKLGGVLRDIIENGLGAKPIGNIELTVVGEIERKRYPELEGNTWSESLIARETVRAIADYGNPMGVPMTLARSKSHPDFSGKPFALGGSIGITTRAAAKKGEPRGGDLVVLVGGRTGNDGLHGATVSSGGITDKTDTGDSTHVQIGHPYTEQKMMRAGLEIRDKGCASARNDFGAAGLISAVGELGENTGGIGGVLINLALVLLKCAGLANWQIALSESQERFAHAIKPEKLAEAMEIYASYELEATVIGIFTENGRLQIIYDPAVKEFHQGMELSGEIALDVPYSCFDDCPLPEIEVVEPPVKTEHPVFPDITSDNLDAMGEALVGQYDVCDQSSATRRYDSTVQGITYQGPLYGWNYNIPSSLAVLRPVYGRPYGLTVSLSFSSWQFEVDPVGAAVNAMMDALATQVIAGVRLHDICLADNFYTASKDPYALYYLREQVKAIAGLSIQTGTPFITGKDSSSGSGTFAGRTVNVPASVAITAMGKVPDVRKLTLHAWQRPGNLLVAIKPYASRLDGSILSAALGITGTRLEHFPVDEAASYLHSLESLAQSGIVQSAVPINCGGIFLRLFEGMEASGYSAFVNSKPSLFAESFGGVLIEINYQDLPRLMSDFHDLQPTVIGFLDEIATGKVFSVLRHRLNWTALRMSWLTSFERKVNHDLIA
jgi:phosphoribosylformylglycinamidine synthase